MTTVFLNENHWRDNRTARSACPIYTYSDPGKITRPALSAPSPRDWSYHSFASTASPSSSSVPAATMKAEPQPVPVAEPAAGRLPLVGRRALDHRGSRPAGTHWQLRCSRRPNSGYSGCLQGLPPDSAIEIQPCLLHFRTADCFAAWFDFGLKVVKIISSFREINC